MQEIAAFSRKSTACRDGKYVDIVGVTGSIPVTPTIPINDLAEKDVAAGRFDKPDSPLPCPFCGRDGIVTSRGDDKDGHIAFITCCCGGFSARAHQYGRGMTEDEAKSEAIAAWNTRFPRPSSKGAVDG